MTPEIWEQITEIYNSALELEESEQQAFLEKACAGDEFLRREVESLLAADRKAGNFIARNAVKDSPSLLTIKNFPSLSGQILGHYQIISRIGVGGMGEVYLAKDSRLNRQVAVKTLPISFSSHPDYLKRFQTEAKAAAKLNHPNVATIYSVEEVDGQSFFTMEYVEGKTLDKLIPKNGMALNAFLEWFIDLADALAHAHEKGIIHRDIKPGNIMITGGGVPKILDFGLAQIDPKSIADEASTLSLTQPGQIMGTPAYMSPEQAEGEQIDECSDIFSFGVVMYEAITGERPFKGDSYSSIIRALLTKEPPPVAELKPEAPFLLARLIMRCLEKNSRKRFGSMREVRIILEEIQAAVEAGISADSASAPILSNRKSFSRGWIITPAILLIVLLCGLGIYYFTRVNPEPPVSFENITLRKLSQTNNIVYAHITPDGNSVAYNSIEEGETRALWIRRVENKNALQLLPPQPLYFWGGLTISTDGSQIYYITAERDKPYGTLYRISSLGGAPRKLVETVNDLGSLSPDGQRVLYVRYGETVKLLSADAFDGSDERVILSTGSRHLYRDPQFSADGEKIFFIKFEIIGGEEYWSLVEIPAAGGDERIIIPARKPKISEVAVLKNGNGLLVNAVDPISNLPQLFHVSPADGRETRITNDLNAYFGISVSNDGETLVAAQRQFAKNIWVVPTGDITQAKELTKESNIYSNAVWTPDGKIVYDAVDNNRPHIWIMNGDGTGAQQLTPNESSDFEPQISPDGRFIVFTSQRTGDRKIWRMNIDGSSPQILTQINGTAFNPVITPDGETVFFTWSKEDNRVLGSVPLAGGEVSEQPLITNSYMSFSPDGRQIAYVVRDDPDQPRRVCVRPVETSESENCFDISPTEFLIWTADGKGLLYRNIESTPDSNSTVWLHPLSGGKSKPLFSVKPDSVFRVSQTKDGSRTAVVRGRLLTDAVMLTRINRK